MSWLAVGLWGAVVGLDASSLGQLMLSRPLVAGTVAGLAFGRPVEGAVVGGLLELFALVVLPVGASRTPEPGTAAVAASAAYSVAAPPGLEAGPLLLAVVFGLGWERIGGVSVHLLRRANEWIVASAPEDGADGLALERRHVGAMLLDALRGAAVSVAGAWLGALVLGALMPRWGLSPELTTTILGATAGAALAATLALFGGWRRRSVALALGLLCGLAVLLA